MAMSTLPLPDLQTLIALAIGLLATVHVVRRWGPAWRRLWTTAPSPSATSANNAQGAPSTPASACGVTAPAPGAACGAGCGQCGSATATAHKDHRVHIVRRASH
jgi:hypothetical protein